MITLDMKEKFRQDCAIAQYQVINPSRSVQRTDAEMAESARHWYSQGVQHGDFTKIVRIAQEALDNCERLNNVEQVRVLARAEIAFNPSMVVNILLSDIAPLRELLLFQPMSIDDYKEALQLIIASFSADPT
jgi:hypothetical protein